MNIGYALDDLLKGDIKDLLKNENDASLSLFRNNSYYLSLILTRANYNPEKKGRPPGKYATIEYLLPSLTDFLLRFVPFLNYVTSSDDKTITSKDRRLSGSTNLIYFCVINIIDSIRYCAKYIYSEYIVIYSWRIDAVFEYQFRIFF